MSEPRGDDDRSKLGAVVLAAGASTRMGSPKPLLRLGAESYLERIIATLARVPVDPVVVVLGHRAEQVRSESRLGATRVVVNARWRHGMLGSLQAGVRELRSDEQIAGLLLTLVDSPRFAASTIRGLAAAWAATRAAIVVPTHGGRHGHPVIFGRALWPEILDAPAETGARAVVDAHRDEMLEVYVDDPWVLRDADTPEDHARMGAGL